jgi:uncharacterized heparinase superfamily protein
MNRYHAWRAVRARPATAFVSQPEPRTIGGFARGRQLLAGNFLFAGVLVEQKDSSIWQIEAPDDDYAGELHGFTWLDDMAAVGDAKAMQTAQAWLYEWVDTYGPGHGIGWTPDLTGRRLIRWINHALFVLNGQPPERSEAFYRSLAQQTIFLSRRWRAASPGLPRFEALAGLIYAGLALEGMAERVDPAIAALSRECAREVDAQGGIGTRNPEELLEVFTLLNWAAAALAEAGRIAEKPHLEAIERIAPTLRALRHADGGLARFHGGGRGLEGRLDYALATSGIKARASEGLAMGYVRLAAGRTSMILDAAPPPTLAAPHIAHASTCAFELTSGRRPLIVSCGSGISFGPEWRRAGRATASHSTLALDGVSSAKLSRGGFMGRGRELLIDAPQDVRVQYVSEDRTDGVIVGHDGYRSLYGLTHIRRLELSSSGRELNGEDTLAAIEREDQTAFDKHLAKTNSDAVGYKLRFHLHPDVDAEQDMGGNAVSMALKSREIWVFRHDGKAQLTVEPSVFLEKGRLKVRATKQIVLTSRAVDYATRIRWSLAKALETPDAVRDLAREDSDVTS